jgi:hypothetical protein
MAFPRRQDLRRDLEAVIARSRRDGGESFETLYMAVWSTVIILRDFYEGGYYDDSLETENRAYMRFVHAEELLTSLSYWARGLSIKDALGQALMWRWDSRVPSPEERIYSRGDLT